MFKARPEILHCPTMNDPHHVLYRVMYQFRAYRFSIIKQEILEKFKVAEEVIVYQPFELKSERIKRISTGEEKAIDLEGDMIAEFYTEKENL